MYIIEPKPHRTKGTAQMTHHYTAHQTAYINALSRMGVTLLPAPETLDDVYTRHGFGLLPRLPETYEAVMARHQGWLRTALRAVSL
jgi:hypothetical protein